MTDVLVTFLGSGDAFGSGGRFQTCISVASAQTHFLLDCGASSLIAMQRCGVRPVAIDMILITHLHGDHFGGLPFFLLDAQFSKRAKPLLIAGPPGLTTRLRDAMEVLFPHSSQTPQRFALEVAELPESTPTTLQSLVVTPEPVTHLSGAPSYALRVECAGRVIAYSGDTEWTDRLLRVATGADLFICEAYFYDKKVKFHLDYETVRAHQNSLGCKRLILTHMSQDMLDRLGTLEVECAADGKTLVL